MYIPNVEAELSRSSLAKRSLVDQLPAQVTCMESGLTPQREKSDLSRPIPSSTTVASLEHTVQIIEESQKVLFPTNGQQIPSVNPITLGALLRIRRTAGNYRTYTRQLTYALWDRATLERSSLLGKFSKVRGKTIALSVEAVQFICCMSF